MTNETRVQRYQQAIEEAISEERPVRSTWKKVKKAIKVTLFSVAAMFALLVTCLIVDISNDTPEERAIYEQPKQDEKVPAQVKGTNTINYREATLRSILSQEVPMVTSFEVTAKQDEQGTYTLANVNGDKNDVDTYALEGDYQVGDVITVLWATSDSSEIAGETKVGTIKELDTKYYKGGNN